MSSWGQSHPNEVTLRKSMADCQAYSFRWFMSCCGEFGKTSTLSRPTSKHPPHARPALALLAEGHESPQTNFSISNKHSINKRCSKKKGRPNAIRTFQKPPKQHKTEPESDSRLLCESAALCLESGTSNQSEGPLVPHIQRLRKITRVKLPDWLSESDSSVS